MADAVGGKTENGWRLPDVLALDLRVVFCGTAVSTESAVRQAYYSHRLNQFWPVLHATGLTPRLLKPDCRQED